MPGIQQSVSTQWELQAMNLNLATGDATITIVKRTAGYPDEVHAFNTTAADYGAAWNSPATPGISRSQDVVTLALGVLISKGLVTGTPY